MKRIRSFHELAPCQQAEAIKRVARMAVMRAEYCGEVWVESATELAWHFRYYMHRGCIWNVCFSKGMPTVVPGTEFRLDGRPA